MTAGWDIDDLLADHDLPDLSLRLFCVCLTPGMRLFVCKCVDEYLVFAHAGKIMDVR